ncbi:MAG: terminase small subunit [Lachnospiraceae bacterium]|nr:terminase small subunit [Lachnospiraceae bacterium]
MNDKQRAFADYYIETGNATQSYIKAGYSEKGANRSANKLLSNADIAAYIAERVRPTEQKRIATGDEVMEFFTAVMKGEIKDAFDLPPSLQDRLNAAKELAKRTVDIGNKEEYEKDNFMDALKEQLPEVMEKAGEIVET